VVYDGSTVETMKRGAGRSAAVLVGLTLLCLACFWTRLEAENQSLSDNDPTLACELVKHEGALLLDVRTWWEYSWSHVPGAKNISVDELSNRLGDVDRLLGGKKGRPIVVYCTKGVRAGEAKTILQKAGFTRITNLGGMSDWQDCD
jgi:phage shock protein E